MATDPRARVRVVSVIVEPLILETRHWCRSCALPSGLRQLVVVRLGEQMHLQPVVRCLDCSGVDVAIDPDRVGRA